MFRYRKHRLVRQALAIGWWQLVTKGVGFAGSVWATRCLDPYKLGISGLTMAIMGQIWFLATPFLDVVLTRHYRLEASAEKRARLISIAFSWRLLVMALVGGLAFTTTFFRTEPEWHLGLMAAFPVLLMVANPPTWLLMAEENMAASSRSAALQSIVMAVLYGLFFRPGQQTGSDIVVLAVSTFVGWIYAWRVALGRFWPLPLVPRLAFQMLPLLWEGRWIILWSVSINLATQFESVLLGWLGNLPDLGKYGTACSLTVSIAGLLGFFPAILYPRFIEWNKAGLSVLLRRQLKLAGAAMGGAIAVAIISFFAAPFAYRITYGPAFTAAAYPFVVLLTAKFVALSSAMMTWGLWAQGRDRTVAIITLPVAILSLLSNVLLIPRFGMMAAACTNLGSELLIFGASFWISRRAAMAESRISK